MRFFHLSDLHIGLRLMNRDLSEDQRYIFDQIIHYALEEKPDAILIAGDIYDKSVPSAEAVDLFDYFISKLRRTLPDTEIMMISGNHDSVSRINIYRSILSDQRIHMIGIPPEKEGDLIEQVTLYDDHGPVHFYLLPFVKPSMVKQILGVDEEGRNLSYDETIHRLIAREDIRKEERNVLVSHQFYLPVGWKTDQVERMDSEIRTVGNIDEVKADVLGSFDYAALGHIHKPMAVGSEFYRYCGTPLACSVSEASQEKGIILIEMEEKGKISTRVLPLHPIRQVKKIKGILKEVLDQSCEDYVSVTLTDKADLNAIDMTERLRQAFPNLLEIRRETYFQANYNKEILSEKESDPYELCLAFLGKIDEEDQRILGDLINQVKEAYTE